MQATATRQDSMQATDTDVPRETTRASTTCFGDLSRTELEWQVLISRIPGYPHTTLFFVRGNKSSENHGSCEHSGSFESSPVVFQKEV
jgi:hypothetical protein